MVPINTAQSKQQAARIFIIQNHHRVACAWMRYVITCLSPYHFIPFLGIYAQAGRSIVTLITCGQRQHKAARDGDLGEDVAVSIRKFGFNEVVWEQFTHALWRACEEQVANLNGRPRRDGFHLLGGRHRHLVKRGGLAKVTVHPKGEVEAVLR